MAIIDEEALRNPEEGKQVRRLSNEKFAPINTSNENIRRLHNATTTMNNNNTETAPKSSGGPFRLPMKIHDIQKSKESLPRLLHPFLHRIPMHIRFGLNGFLSNFLFMIAYNEAINKFEHLATPSTIYSIVYLVFIPVSHAFLSILVFGWPERYIPSLMSNTPIGITAIILGATLTAYLDEIKFNKFAVDAIAANWEKIGYDLEATVEEEKGEFYSSLLVLFVTGVWTFFLSVFVNASTEKTHKKKQ